MTTNMRIGLTLLILALFAVFLVPYFVGGILGPVSSVLVIVATIAGIVAIWVPPHRLKQLLRTN